MGKTTIPWCDYTLNIWLGCAKVPGSPACDHCYAEGIAKRFHKVSWGPHAERVRTKNWQSSAAAWNRKAARDGVRRKVLCMSMGDLFEDQSDWLHEWRMDFFYLVAENWRNLDWLLLTKRPENVLRMVAFATQQDPEQWFHNNPHVWIGTTVENQEWADKRIPKLLKIPAKVRFLSCEPLLGPVDLDGYLPKRVSYEMAADAGDLSLMGEPAPYPAISQVIVGGESGPHARPMHPQWVRDLRDQCAAADVPFFFKQWGEDIPRGQFMADGMESLLYAAGCEAFGGVAPKRSVQWDDRMWAYRVGVKKAGHLLDGVEYHAFPEV